MSLSKNIQNLISNTYKLALNLNVKNVDGIRNFIRRKLKMKLWLSLFLLLGLSLSAGEHQEFLKKKSMSYPGWEDEHVLEVQASLPAYKRMGTAELHRQVFKSIALEKRCLARNVASITDPEDECIDFQQ